MEWQWKVSVILAEISFDKFNGDVYTLSMILFTSRNLIYNALPFENVVLGGNKKCEEKTFLWLNFLYYKNDMIHIMKIHILNHSHYY